MSKNYYYIYIIILINIFTITISENIIEKNIDCNGFDDCFNCFSCGKNGQEHCSCSQNSSNTKCQETNQNKETLTNLLANFSQCTDFSSIEKQIDFCGNLKINLDELKTKEVYSFELEKKNNNEYGFKNLFYEYKFFTNNPLDYYYSIDLEINKKFEKNITIDLETIDINSNKILIEINDKNYSQNYYNTELRNKKEFKFIVLCQEKFSQSPFIFKIKKNNTKNSKKIYVDIAIICIVGIFCGELCILLLLEQRKKRGREMHNYELNNIEI